MNILLLHSYSLSCNELFTFTYKYVAQYRNYKRQVKIIINKWLRESVNCYCLRTLYTNEKKKNNNIVYWKENCFKNYLLQCKYAAIYESFVLRVIYFNFIILFIHFIYFSSESVNKLKLFEIKNYCEKNNRFGMQIFILWFFKTVKYHCNIAKKKNKKINPFYNNIIHIELVFWLLTIIITYISIFFFPIKLFLNSF